MKQALIGGYLTLAVICSLGFWLFGENSYRSYAYNLGQSIVWPVSLFKSHPEIDGSTPLKFASSYQRVEASGAPEYNGRFNEAIGILSFYYYAESDKDVGLEEFNGMMYGNNSSQRFFASLIEDERIRTKLAEELDGESFGDIVSSRDDYEEDLMDLLEERG